MPSRSALVWLARSLAVKGCRPVDSCFGLLAVPGRATAVPFVRPFRASVTSSLIQSGSYKLNTVQHAAQSVPNGVDTPSASETGAAYASTQ